MKVFVTNAKWSESRLIKKVVNYTAQYLNQPQQLEVNISIVDSDEIRQLNNSQRNIDSVTDVLSFPNIEAERKPIDIEQYKNDIDFATGNLMLGDIIICRQRALEQAQEYNHSYKRELAFLALHGILHLFGYDHVESDDEQQMTDLQRKILDNLKITRN